METITIFIDAEYLLQSLRGLKDSEKSIPKDNFDFAKFIDFLLNGRKINSVYYYTARLDKNENPKTFDEQTEFLNNIKNSLNAYNVNIRLGQMIKTKIKNQSTWNKYRKAEKKKDTYTWIQKGVDTRIVLDMCKYAYTDNAENNACAILVSGDEDFEDILAFLKEKNFSVELFTFDRRRSRPSKSLIRVVDKHITLNKQILVENKIVACKEK